MQEYLELKKSNCKNCYKCIRHCPVKSIRFSGNQAHIIQDECILCGQCFVVCPQDAKRISDDTERAKVLIANSDKVIASIAPSFAANYVGIGIEGLRAALQKLGFYDAEETAVGATYVKREYEKMTREHSRDVIISSCCSSVNLLIQKHYPDVLPYLADVMSPMVAHCADIKHRHPDAHTIFIGPCVSKKDEAARNAGLVDLALTFEELTKWLEKENITLEPQPDKREDSRTRLFPTSGGILRSMDCEDTDYDYIAVDGLDNCMAALKDIAKGGMKNCFIEMSACRGSCVGGPVMEKYHDSPIRNTQEVLRYAGKKDFDVPQPKDITQHRVFIGTSAQIPGTAEIESILRQMGKRSKADELNCGTCGYNTCREKAVAVYQGKADMTMCLPFLKEKAESFSDNIINNTPNGIIVLNEQLEVQQVNTAACHIMNLRGPSDVLGEQVICILDPKPFMDVRDTGRGINDRRVYLAEYKRFVEETIVFDREYRLLICILRDVTSEQAEREKKEEISKKTVEIADNVVEKQMRVVQEIASLLGETTAETKIALTKLKESIRDE